MKSFKNLIFIFFFFLLYNGNVLANDKIAFIDINYLIEKSNFGKDISKSINEFNDTNKEKIQSNEKKLIEQENKIKKVQNIITQEELKIKVLKLREDIKIFNKEKKDISIEFNNKKNAKLKEFFDKINPVISDYMNKESITIIIEKKNIFIGLTTHDITNDILKIINSKFN